ncbi:hypothetical protein CMK10_12475 [Candidatus Poribacteria bacterium]|nr:hypothetical protein [Candidatus Poribacteria bacterium]
MKFQRRAYSILFLFLLHGFLMKSDAAQKIAVVDFADQWTQVDALRQTLDEFKVQYDDLTKDIENGKLKFEVEHKLFFIGSMTTNDPKLHQSLDDNAQEIQDFVKNGGIVIEPTQADQNEANVDWLPNSLQCIRSDRDSKDFKILKADHSLFAAPNKMGKKEFQGWGHQGWPTVWEVIASQKGFDIIMESIGNPVIMEADFGKGKFVMMSLAPDKYHIKGNDENTKKMAGKFMENILEAYKPKAVDVTSKLASRWAELKSHSVLH